MMPFYRAGGLCFLGLALLGCVPPTRPAEDVPARPQRLQVQDPAPVRHVLKPGETVWAVSRAYGVPVEEIVAANGLQDVTDLPVGRELLIPGATELRTVSQTDLYGRYRPGPALAWPVAGREILSRYGAPRKGYNHTGLDINGRRGDPVTAAAAGTVTHSSPMRGYGKTVILDHGDGLRTLYAHNTALLVRVGDRVQQGEPIARIGRTGNASTDHLHFEVHLDDRVVDPLKFLGSGAGPLPGVRSGG